MILKLPKDERKPNQAEIKTTCIIINTSDYCCLTINQLEEKILETIDIELRPMISFETEIGSFLLVTATSIQILVKLVENTADAHFMAMTRKSWASLASVGDQSEHITQIAQTLSPSIMLIRKMFVNTSKCFKLFCEKFAE
jgi:hypothetical protein